MTETCAYGCVQTSYSMNYGSIGEAIDSNTEIKIKSVPEMEYTVNDSKMVVLGGQQHQVVCPRGELMIKGPSVFRGYYKDEQKTKESFEDGFFLTGDIAEYNPVLKEVKLIDRKRGIIKLSQGEFISVNQIEDAIVKAPCVENCYLCANRFYPYTVAVICPNKGYLAGKGINCDDAQQLQHAIRFVTQEVRDTCKQFGLKSFEVPKACIVEMTQWTPDNGFLTPALKVKRPSCKQMYEKFAIEINERIMKNEKATPDQIALISQTVMSEDIKEKNETSSGYTGMR